MRKIYQGTIPDISTHLLFGFIKISLSTDYYLGRRILFENIAYKLLRFVFGKQLLSYGVLK